MRHTGQPRLLSAERHKLGAATDQLHEFGRELATSAGLPSACSGAEETGRGGADDGPDEQAPCEHDRRGREDRGGDPDRDCTCE